MEEQSQLRLFRKKEKFDIVSMMGGRRMLVKQYNIFKINI